MRICELDRGESHLGGAGRSDQGQNKKEDFTAYQDFDHVTLPELDENSKKNFYSNGSIARKRGGVQFQKKRLPSKAKEPWDCSISPCDHGWASGDINSYLHLITKFLTIFSFDYEIVKAGQGPLD